MWIPCDYRASLRQRSVGTAIGIPILLSVVILAACLRPVRRAARVDPVDVLRAL